MKWFVILLIGAILMAGTVASAAYLNVQGGNLGAGTSLVGGFTISTINWHTKFVEGQATAVAAAFDVSPAAARVYASLEGVPDSFVTCQPGSSYGTDWVCTFNVIPSAVTTIQIVAEN